MTDSQWLALLLLTNLATLLATYLVVKRLRAPGSRETDALDPWRDLDASTDARSGDDAAYEGTERDPAAPGGSRDEAVHDEPVRDESPPEEAAGASAGPAERAPRRGFAGFRRKTPKAGGAAELTYQVGERGERLWIVNSGRGEAWDVQVLLDDAPPGDHPLVAGDGRHPRTVAGDAEFSIPLLPGEGRPKRFKVTIHWSDETGEGRSLEANASLY